MRRTSSPSCEFIIISYLFFFDLIRRKTFFFFSEVYHTSFPSVEMQCWASQYEHNSPEARDTTGIIISKRHTHARSDTNNTHTEAQLSIMSCCQFCPLTSHKRAITTLVYIYIYSITLYTRVTYIRRTAYNTSDAGLMRSRESDTRDYCRPSVLTRIRDHVENNNSERLFVFQYVCNSSSVSIACPVLHVRTIVYPAIP